MDFTNLKNFMDYMARCQSPGNAVQVYKDGKRVFEYTSGYSDYEAKVPLNGDEYYNIYSCSKITTVTAALQLLEKGYFLLDDPLSEFIPEYRQMFLKNQDGEIVEAKNPITIGDLFTMTAGFTYNLDNDAIAKTREITNGKMDTDVFARCMASEILSFEPGTRWKYSLCHDVLGGVVSILTGMKFSEYVKKNIFEPLEMNNSGYHRSDGIYDKMCSQYTFVPDGQADEFDIVEAQKYGKANNGIFKKVEKTVIYDLGENFDSGGAGIVTTVSDYAKLAVALANYGIGINGERILSRGTVELLQQNRLSEAILKNDLTLPQLRGYGYSLGVRTLINKTKGSSIGSLGEFGWGGAAGASVLVDPQQNLAVFYAQHCLNPREAYYQPRLRNVVYSCLDR